LIASSNSQNAVEFDHEEFRNYFLGEEIARRCLQGQPSAKADIASVLRRGTLAESARTPIIQAIVRSGSDARKAAIELLSDVARIDGQSSFTHDNCASLILAFLSNMEPCGVTLTGMNFPENALCNKSFVGVIFEDCFFAPTSLKDTSLVDCRFTHCRLARLDFFATTVLKEVRLRDSTIDAASLTDRGFTAFEPAAVMNLAARAGIVVEEQTPELNLQAQEIPVWDDELTSAERVFRCFGRTTHISENLIQKKLGGTSNQFIANVLPRLLHSGVFMELTNTGGGTQRHFRLGISMAALNQALESSRGSFSTFIEQAEAVSVR
jgi:uncharacterized protein YjbI with pentapeptide repeats